MKYHTYPSLKSEDDRKALWEGLLDGRLSTLATDLVSTTWEEKIRFKTVADVTGGHNGIETRMGIAYSVGVVELGMSLRNEDLRRLPHHLRQRRHLEDIRPLPRGQKGASDCPNRPVCSKSEFLPLGDFGRFDICIIDPSFDRDLTLDDLPPRRLLDLGGLARPRLARVIWTRPRAAGTRTQGQSGV